MSNALADRDKTPAEMSYEELVATDPVEAIMNLVYEYGEAVFGDSRSTEHDADLAYARVRDALAKQIGLASDRVSVNRPDLQTIIMSTQYHGLDQQGFDAGERLALEIGFDPEGKGSS